MHYTIRSTSAVIGFWLGAGLLSLIALSPLLSGQWRVLLFALPISGFLIWSLWLLLYRPALRYDESRAVVWNIGRYHVLPWASIASMQQSFNLVFVLQSGKRIVAQGTPYPRRRNTMAPSQVPIRMRESRNYDGDISVLEGFRTGAHDDGSRDEHFWDAPGLIIGAGLLLLVASTSLIGALSR